MGEDLPEQVIERAAFLEMEQRLYDVSGYELWWRWEMSEGPWQGIEAPSVEVRIRLPTGVTIARPR